jgi:glycosyltransferase involved in cell wall biosynthesis
MARFPPFIDTTLFQMPPAIAPNRLITVAMMRPGDKLESYAMLAKALDLIREKPWALTVIGDGQAADAVKAMYAGFSPHRITFLGQQSPEQIAVALQQGGTYVWPGCGEAYGLAYLEAQAAGLPVVAQATAGVPEVVISGTTGLLTSDGDIPAFADAIATLLDEPMTHAAMRTAARAFVHGERSLEAASKRLDTILRQYLGERYER